MDVTVFPTNIPLARSGALQTDPLLPGTKEGASVEARPEEAGASRRSAHHQIINAAAMSVLSINGRYRREKGPAIALLASPSR